MEVSFCYFGGSGRGFACGSLGDVDFLCGGSDVHMPFQVFSNADTQVGVAVDAFKEFQSFLQEALVSSSGMGRDVHSLMLSIQHFLCQPWCCQPSNKGALKDGLERLLWRVTSRTMQVSFS